MPDIGKFKKFRLPIVAVMYCFTIAVSAQTTELEENRATVLEEVIVTAQKMGAQDLLSVPMSLTAINGDELVRRDIKGMNDYLRFEPGTNFVDRGVSRNSVIIRGITADPGRGGAIAGIYIDETPVQGLGFGGGSPDLKLVDVERVEVLRGPQGTLYGGGSMSGTGRLIHPLSRRGFSWAGQRRRVTEDSIQKPKQ